LGFIKEGNDPGENNDYLKDGEENVNRQACKGEVKRKGRRSRPSQTPLKGGSSLGDSFRLPTAFKKDGNGQNIMPVVPFES
jgi:hypothetical protein